MSSSRDIELVKIAQVLKSNGTDGDVIAGFRDISPEDLDIEEPVFIYFDGLPVPFFIESITKKGTSKAIVKFTDIDSFADSEEIRGREIYLPAGSIESCPSMEGDLTGWKVFGSNGAFAGEISSFEDIPGNPCLEVTLEGRTYLIPAHDDLILSIDEQEQSITMIIPEGLF